MQILLGITGGIAAYKTPDLVRVLTAAGHQVRCVLTEHAAQLVAPQALVTVSGHAVYESLWSQEGRIPHIETVRWCDLLLVAPATANFMAKAALGLADDLLSTGILALEPHKPCIMAPAMNTVMWNKPIVQQHVVALSDSGVRMVDPIPGNLACGEEGVGAMASVDELLAVVQEYAS